MNVTVEITNDCDCCWVPDNNTCHSWIRDALDSMNIDKSYCVSLRFVKETESKNLNAKYRGEPTATNVLSFPPDFPAGITDHLQLEPMGDIVVCPDVLELEAEQQGKSIEAHWAHLLIHGVLHLLGHEHDDDDSAAAMEQLEIKVLEKLGFPNPYLVG
jgi:probable rRNA maturation factor